MALLAGPGPAVENSALSQVPLGEWVTATNFAPDFFLT